MRANVTTSVPINVYAYHAKNLYLAYSLAIFLALVANVLGTAAYISNGVSHNNSFSSILRATRNPSLLNDCGDGARGGGAVGNGEGRNNGGPWTPRRRTGVPGALPLDREVGMTVLRLEPDGFVVWQEGKV